MHVLLYGNTCSITYNSILLLQWSTILTILHPGWIVWHMEETPIACWGCGGHWLMADHYDHQAGSKPASCQHWLWRNVWSHQYRSNKQPKHIHNIMECYNFYIPILFPYCSLLRKHPWSLNYVISVLRVLSHVDAHSYLGSCKKPFQLNILVNARFLGYYITNSGQAWASPE